MEKCTGCGAELQTTNEHIPGYLPPIKEEKKHIICKRCHSIMNQNKLLCEIPNFSEKDINYPPNALYIVVFDTIGYPKSISNFKFLNSKNVWLIGTKLDLLPKSVNMHLLNSQIKRDFPDVAGHSFVSTKSSLGMKEFINNIQKYRISKGLLHICLMGFANSGKTSVMNRLLKMSQQSPTKNRNGTILTHSSYPGTTVGNIEFPLKKMTIFGSPLFGKLIDTPGLYDSNANYELLNHNEIFSISSQKEAFKARSFVIPKYYQKSVFIGGLTRIDVLDIKDDPLKIVWFGPTTLAPHFVNFDKADDFWRRYITKKVVHFGPPYDPISLNPMELISEFKVGGDPDLKTTVKEIVVKNFGWFNILKDKGEATIRVHSSLPNSIFTRNPFIKSYNPNGITSQVQRFFGAHVLKMQRYIKL